MLSPEQDWYVHTLIPEFQKSPVQKQEVGETVSLTEIMKRFALGAVSWISEQWGLETLRENVTTSAENESSVVLYGNIGGHGILLTGDSGIRALSATVNVAKDRNCSLSADLRFIQVPHHGSRNNVSPTVLDGILGQRKSVDDGTTAKTAFVSASKDSSTHPRKAVINGLIRRGVKVVATRGNTIRHHHKMPKRSGWGTVTPLSFSTTVESWD